VPEPQIQRVSCPSCGAPLLFSAGETTTRCTFCNAVVERPDREGAPARIPSAPPRTAGPGSSPAFLRMMISLAGLLVVALAGVGFFFTLDRGGIAGSAFLFNGKIAALDVDRPEGPDFIAAGYDIGGGKYETIRVDPIAKKIVWRGPGSEDAPDLQALAAAGGRYFAVEGSELAGYSAADGKELWRSELSDKPGYCAECLTLTDDLVIVLTQDYVIEAFRTDSGSSVWKRRMAGYTSGFTVVDGAVWVIDTVAEKTSLFALDVRDGAVRRTITPECRRSDGNFSGGLSGSTSQIAFDPPPQVPAAERAVYLFYGWYPACIERRAASDGSLAWQIEDDEGFSPSGDINLLSAGPALFFSAGDQLWSVAASDGRLTGLSAGGDYDLVPLALAGGTLIVRTKRTRGSTQFGLRGMDPATGTTLWEKAYKNSEPLEPPDAAFPYVEAGQSIFGWRIVGGSLRVFRFQSGPNQIAFETADPAGGTFAAEDPVPLPDVSDGYFGPEVIGWTGDVVWLTLDAKLYGLDVAAGTIKYRFP
jgi:LSD1 subclass zinc finger protein